MPSPEQQRSRSNSQTREHHASNAEESRPTTPMSNASSEKTLVARYISRELSPTPTLCNDAQQGRQVHERDSSGEGESDRTDISRWLNQRQVVRRRREEEQRISPWEQRREDSMDELLNPPPSNNAQSDRTDSSRWLNQRQVVRRRREEEQRISPWEQRREDSMDELLNPPPSNNAQELYGFDQFNPPPSNNAQWDGSDELGYPNLPPSNNGRRHRRPHHAYPSHDDGNDFL
jgi:hypothetical protein